MNCMDLLKGEPRSSSETCLVSPYDGNRVAGIKVEEVTDVKEEEHSESITSPAMKSEHEKCMELLKSEPDICNETCVASSYDGNQVIDIKVEEVTCIKEEEDPQSVSSPVIKTEHEVSCMSLSPVYSTAVSAGVKKQVVKRASTAHTASAVFICIKSL